MINDLQDLVEIASVMKFEETQVAGAATNVFNSDVPESEMRYVFGAYLSETSGGANTLTISKVEEDDTTTPIVNAYNLGANESEFLSAGDVSLILPALEGGTNLELNSGSDGVNVTLLWYPDEIV